MTWGDRAVGAVVGAAAVVAWSTEEPRQYVRGCIERAPRATYLVEERMGIIRPNVIVDFSEISYENGEREIVGWDVARNEALVQLIYFPGGLGAAKRKAYESGEGLFVAPGDGPPIWLARATWILNYVTKETIRRGIERRIEVIQRAREDEAVHDPLTDDYVERTKREGFKV